MTNHLSDYIFKNAFHDFGYKLCVRNETSRTLYTKYEMIKIRELKEDGLILELQANVCQKGHSLTLFFISKDTENKITIPLSGHYKEALFEAIGKVLKLEANTEKKENVFIDLQFTQYNLANWKKVLKLYAANQDQINEMLKRQRKQENQS